MDHGCRLRFGLPKSHSLFLIIVSQVELAIFGVSGRNLLNVGVAPAQPTQPLVGQCDVDPATEVGSWVLRGHSVTVMEGMRVPGVHLFYRKSQHEKPGYTMASPPK